MGRKGGRSFIVEDRQLRIQKVQRHKVTRKGRGGRKGEREVVVEDI
jgi:hypothetical protein